MFKIKLLCLSCLLFLTTAIHAQNNVLTESKKIQSIEVLNHGGFILNFAKDEPDICLINDANAIFIFPNHNGVTDAGVKSLLSTALIAYTSNLSVKVMYSFSLNSYCWGSALQLSK